MTQPPKYIKAIIESAAKRYGLSPSLLTTLLRQESGFNIRARSSAGAQGIAQFMPGTARGLGVDPWNPYSAIPGAAKYLSSLINQFGGSTALGLAAYNAGPGNVRKYGGIPPFPETQNYVRAILGSSAVDTAPRGERKETYYKPTEVEQVGEQPGQPDRDENRRTKMMDILYRVFAGMLKRQAQTKMEKPTSERLTKTLLGEATTQRSPISLGPLGREGYNKLKPGYGMFPMPPTKTGA